MRPARRYSSRIEVYDYIANPDGAGGNTRQETKIGDAWAEVQTIRADKLYDFGLNENEQAARFYLRYRTDIDLMADNVFFKYRGTDWEPVAVINDSLENKEIEFICSSGG